MISYFSTVSFSNHTLKEIVSVCIKHNINIELGSSVDYEPDVLTEILLAKDKVRFLVHNYFPPHQEPFVLNLASDDPVIYEHSMTLCRRAVDFCVSIGSPFYSVHAGFAFHATPSMLGDPIAQSRLSPTLHIPREKAYERFILSVKDLSSYAQDKKIQLLIENNVIARELRRKGDEHPLLLADIDEIARFFGDICDPNIGLLLDAGHAKVTATTLGIRPERFFEVLHPYIRALHLSDNDGMRDTHERFSRDVWFSPHLKDYHGIPMVIEAGCLTIAEMLAQREVLAELVS